MAGINVSETAMIEFNKNVSKKFLEGGNQLKPVLGSKWKVATKSAKEIKFFITTEALSMEKPAVGSLIAQSKGGKITTVVVRPKTYLVTSIIDQIEMDSTGINLSAEFEDIHARAMGIRTDMVILETISKAVYLTDNKIDVKLEEYDTPTGWVKVIEKIAAIGGAKTKYLIVDSAAHAKLLRNEQFINSDYGTSGPVSTGSLNGQTRLGMQVLLLNDLDASFHGVRSLIEKVSGAKDKCYLVTEESLCAGTHQEAASTYIGRQPMMNNDWLIQTEMSLGSQILTNRAMWEITIK